MHHGTTAPRHCCTAALLQHYDTRKPRLDAHDRALLRLGWPAAPAKERFNDRGIGGECRNRPLEQADVGVLRGLAPAACGPELGNAGARESLPFRWGEE